MHEELMMDGGTLLVMNADEEGLGLRSIRWVNGRIELRAVRLTGTPPRILAWLKRSPVLIGGGPDGVSIEPFKIHFESAALVLPAEVDMESDDQALVVEVVELRGVAIEPAQEIQGTPPSRTLAKHFFDEERAAGRPAEV